MQRLRYRVHRALHGDRPMPAGRRVRALLINYNRLEWPRRMAEQLAGRLGVEPVILDNASTYPPTLEWYRSCPYKVVRLGYNFGHLAPWITGHAYWAGARYIVSDPDLDLSGVPADAVSHLVRELDANPQLRKVGLGLRIDDLPDTPAGREAARWEQQFWTDGTGGGFFDANIDTTFAVYAAEREGLPFMRARRSDAPYLARHLPWYLTPESLSDEGAYYLRTLARDTHWSVKQKEQLDRVESEGPCCRS
jgi:hypothetical protein